jgi:hypothetical protein
MISISTDELRRIFGMPRDGRVSMAVVNGYREVADFAKGYRYDAVSNDHVFVFAGPREKLKATITYGEDEVKVEITFPNEGVETRVS